MRLFVEMKMQIFLMCLIDVSREQTERERREAHTRIELLQSEIERLKDEISHKNDTILEREKIIQDNHYKQHQQIFLERQSIEERMSHDGKRFAELAEKFVKKSPRQFLSHSNIFIRTRHLEEELGRVQHTHTIDRR